ncbi:MAG TPA: hypothetical protein EYG38_14385 [Verrucomicrobia bacterium]|nr:hypothetical protein [Verrucomicrobiota bacterium]
MRSTTDNARLQRFIKGLGQRVTGNGRVYLTGGATALLKGWRSMTIDIDLKADPEPNGFFEAIAELKNELDLNVELAAPDQFIPELPAWKERSEFICREGLIDFYHYDLYSQALSKIERNHERDRMDINSMVQSGELDRKKLFNLFQEIKSALIRYPAIEPSVFEKAVTEFCGPE